MGRCREGDGLMNRSREVDGLERGMGRWREGDGGINRSREVNGWVIGARGGVRDGYMERGGWRDE